MTTNLAIDKQLPNQAQKIGHIKTKKETVNLALTEFMNKKKQLEIISLFNTLDPDPDYDYKKARVR